MACSHIYRRGPKRGQICEAAVFKDLPYCADHYLIPRIVHRKQTGPPTLDEKLKYLQRGGCNSDILQLLEDHHPAPPASVWYCEQYLGGTQWGAITLEQLLHKLGASSPTISRIYTPERGAHKHVYYGDGYRAVLQPRYKTGYIREKNSRLYYFTATAFVTLFGPPTQILVAETVEPASSSATNSL